MVSAWGAALLTMFVASSTVAAEDTALPPPAQWSLREVVALALERNPDLHQAAARAEAAMAQVGEAEAAFYPQVAARVTFARTDDPARAFGMILSQRRFTFDTNFNRPGPTQDVRPEVFAAFPLFRGGEHYFRREAARAGARAAAAETQATRNAIVDAAAQAYYALLAAPEQLEVARASRAVVQSALENTRTRLAAGAALKSDVLSLEARLAAAEMAEVRARNGVELARSALRLVLSLPAQEAVAVRPEGELALNLPTSVVDALGQARDHRAELVAARELVAQRQAEVAAERAAFLPRVDLIGSYGQNATDLRLSASRDNWFFGATAEVDMFSGFGKLERLRAAEQRLAEARHFEEKTRATVEHEVRVAFSNWEEAQQRVRVSEAQVAAAEEAFRLVQAQYRAGAVIVTRYLEAEAAQTEARSQAVAARYDFNRSAAALRKAVGRWGEEIQP